MPAFMKKQDFLCFPMKNSKRRKNEWGIGVIVWMYEPKEESLLKRDITRFASDTRYEKGISGFVYATC